MNKTIEEYTKEIHQQNVSVGWWDNPDECIYQKIQLISTEICEATEGERKNLMDDHLPTRKMGEVELADALIRTLDLGAKLGCTYTELTSKRRSPFIRECNSIGKQHLGLTVALVDWATSFHLDDEVSNSNYSVLVNGILCCAEINNYNIFDAMDEKIIYNKTRQDHSRAKRKQAGGKTF